MAFSEHQQEALRILHYIFPSITLAYYVIAQTFSFCSGQSSQDHFRQVKRKPIALLQFALLLLYTLEALLLVIEHLIGFWSHSSSADSNFYVLFEVLIWTLLSANLLESNESLVWYPLYGSWIICAAAEIVLFGLEVPTVRPSGHQPNDPSRYLALSLHVTRLALMVLLLLLHFHHHESSLGENDEESSALLHPPANAATKALHSHVSYGSAQTGSHKDKGATEDNESESAKPDLEPRAHYQELRTLRDWLQYVKGFAVFIPLLWPIEKISVQVSIFGVLFCLVVGRVLNLLLPRQFGILIDSFSIASIDHTISFPGMQLGLFLLYRFLTSYKIMIEIESSVWLPFGNHAVRKIKSAAHARVLAMSHDFHASRETEELTKIIDHGTTVTWLLRNFLMFLVPSILDIIIFGVYLSSAFGIYMALLLSITLVLYIWVSKSFATKQVALQAKIIAISKKEDQILHRSVFEWEHVSSFNAQAHENEKLSRITDQRLLAESDLQRLIAQGNIFAEFMLHLGFAIASAFVIFQIIHGNQSVGDFAMMAFYVINVSSDIHSIAVLGLSLLEDLAEVESLKELITAQPLLSDGRSLLRAYEGAVLFSSVDFSDDEKHIAIQDFNFSVKAGERVAIVGETEASKTMLLRLLIRYHDVQAGKIIIDGQDIRDVTLSSLRDVIGLISEIPTLFEDTVLENVRLAKLDATDEDVIEACKEADIHDKILSFTNGYETIVGEGGVKLTEDEKQQIVIAQIALKNPRIILMEETPSSVDSDTKIDSRIRRALWRLTGGKTTFVVAHRSLTVQKSDVVLVMKGGKIVEQGSPSELMKADSAFAKIWRNEFEIESDYHALDDKELAAEHIPAVGQPGDPNLYRHVRDGSGSSFRPDAPEFVPHVQLSKEPRSGQVTPLHVGSGHQHDCRDAVTHAQSHGGGANRRSQSPTKRVYNKPSKKLAKGARKLDKLAETANFKTHEDIPTSQLDGSTAPTVAKGRNTPRLSRWQRRHQARSDPNSSAVSSDHPESSTPMTGSRHVSGPGRLSSESTNSRTLDSSEKETPKGHHQQNRRKRHYQSRLRKSQQSTSEETTQNDKISPPLDQENITAREFDIAQSSPKEKENVITGQEQTVSQTPTAGMVAAGNVSFAQAT